MSEGKRAQVILLDKKKVELTIGVSCTLVLLFVDDNIVQWLCLWDAVMVVYFIQKFVSVDIVLDNKIFKQGRLLTGLWAKLNFVLC